MHRTLWLWINTSSNNKPIQDSLVDAIRDRESGRERINVPRTEKRKKDEADSSPHVHQRVIAIHRSGQSCVVFFALFFVCLSHDTNYMIWWVSSPCLSLFLPPRHAKHTRRENMNKLPLFLLSLSFSLCDAHLGQMVSHSSTRDKKQIELNDPTDGEKRSEKKVIKWNIEYNRCFTWQLLNNAIN